MPGTTTETLSDRQREITALFAEGHSLEDVADELDIAPSTVKSQMLRVRAKIGLLPGQAPHAFADVAKTALAREADR